VSSHIGSFANLAGYPPFKPTSSFVLTSLTNLSLEYGNDTSQESASKGRLKFPLIKTSGTYLNTTSSFLGDEQTSSMGEEVGTMQIRVLGEIKNEQNKKSNYLTCQKKRKKEERKEKKKK
jgi:hypothetical protein